MFEQSGGRTASYHFLDFARNFGQKKPAVGAKMGTLLIFEK
jgi:hypothetical protein